jgi:hypothetical protein
MRYLSSGASTEQGWLHTRRDPRTLNEAFRYRNADYGCAIEASRPTYRKWFRVSWLFGAVFAVLMAASLLGY